MIGELRVTHVRVGSMGELCLVRGTVMRGFDEVSSQEH